MCLLTVIAGVFAREPIVSWSSKLTYVMFGGFFLAVITGTWTGAVAARKNRNSQFWFIVGFLLPVIGLVAIYLLPDRKASERESGKPG